LHKYWIEELKGDAKDKKGEWLAVSKHKLNYENRVTPIMETATDYAHGLPLYNSLKRYGPLCFVYDVTNRICIFLMYFHWTFQYTCNYRPRATRRYPDP